MKTTKECSVAVAFAELGRLERDRAEFAAAKQTLRETLHRQHCDLASLRERFEAQRPKAIAKLRRERAEREQVREQLTARLIAEAEAAHGERLELIRAELEAKRLRLAAVEAADTVPRPGRRLLEWSVPVAAAALVGFLGFTLFDDEAVAQAAPVAQVEATTAPTAEPAPEPEPTPIVEAEPAPEPEPEPEPTPVTEPEPVKKSSSKKSSSKKSSSKKSSSKEPNSKESSEPKTETKPVIKKNSNPLELDDFGGNPLG